MVQDKKFSRQYRLSHPNEFKAVFQTGRKLSSRNLVLYFKKNTLPHARIGIVVSKRNIRQSIARNLIKRIIRESFRINQIKFNDFDIVVVVYKNYAALSRQEMRGVVDEALKKCFSQTS